MTVVIGTAGHIDHGKTTLLRALTGIDADRLPEERRRGMTIDVGYAHLALDDGSAIDFVDVPGHDRLVGNMLVGAGEIDAALLVVAADDGPRAQTLEHLALLDALGVRPGVAVVTKVDAVDPERVAAVRAEVTALLAPTSLAGSPVLAASGVTGGGIEALRAALVELAAGVVLAVRPPSLAIDRVFPVKGRGTVVTGTLRGGPLVDGAVLRRVPGETEVRVRAIQVHGRGVDRVEHGGRTALNVAGPGADGLGRGDVLTGDPEVRAADRILATFRGAAADRMRARFHAATAATDATIGRAGHDAIELADGTPAGIVRLATPVALRAGDAFVLRRGPGQAPVGGTVLDVAPARGISRRRQAADRVGRLRDAVQTATAATAATSVSPATTMSPATTPVIAETPDAVRAARLELHGAIGPDLAADVAAAGREAALDLVAPDATLAATRTGVARLLRRHATLSRDDASVAADRIVDGLVRDGDLARDGDRLRRPGTAPAAPDPALTAAMDRLERALATAAPPALGAAAREAACPPDGIRALERAGRIVVLEPDLAYAMSTYRDLAARAVAMAGREPLTPAAYRDATGTSRKYVMAILEDLDRRAILRRTPAGHVPGPRAPSARPDPGTSSTPAAR